MTNRLQADFDRSAGRPRGPTSHFTYRTPAMRKCFNPSVFILIILGMAGCDFLDPRGVTNPTVTEENFGRTSNAAVVWAHGVERQLSTTVDQLATHGEVASDNLFNNRTLINRTFDIPQLDPTDENVIGVQRAVHRLREMADHGLNVIVPGDPRATDEIRARLHFYRGYASLAAGEYFVGLPGEANGPALEAGEHLARAVADFEQARALSSDATTRTAALLMTARAHYRAGNRAAAEAAALEVRNTAPNLLRVVQFDVTDGPTNTLQFAVYDSGQDEFQPLPRLDFLFPKYYSVAAGDQSSIAIAKGEEAFLILAEARIAQGNLAEARMILTELLGVVAARPTALINDRSQLRGRRGGTWIYPNSSNVLVAASPDDEPRAGLVLTRGGGPVRIPVVSGTSVTETMIANATTEEALLELLYLMRQEIFVLEGRRMVDLGIRLPISIEEAEVNPNVGLDSPYLEPRIPPWIPGDYGMDAFTYQDGGTLAVIHHNLNRALVQNRTSDAVLPFH